jgi:DNA-binding transcriptional LysR family regulator
VVLVAQPPPPPGRRRVITEDDLVRLGRPLYRLRWWQFHHPAIARLAEGTGRAIELPMELARPLVAKGMRVGFFTRATVAEDLRGGSLTEIQVRGLAPITRQSALVRRVRAARLSPAATRLVALLRAEAETLGLLRERAADGRPAESAITSRAGVGARTRKLLTE